MSTEKYILRHVPVAFQDRVRPAVADLRRDLLELDVEKLNLAPYQRSYFLKHHIQRVDFSLAYSAAMLCRVAMELNRPFEEIHLVDLGAGMGTSYLLASRLGFGSVIYNDIVDDSCRDAAKLCDALHVKLTGFVTGDIETVKTYLLSHGKTANALISRNVIEHIPDLGEYYGALSSLSKGELAIVQGTSANPYNLAMNLWHLKLHLKYEPIFRKKRAEMIREFAPELKQDEVSKIADKTREYYGQKLKEVVQEFVRTGKIVAHQRYRFNTVEPSSGSWNERILSRKQYAEFASHHNLETLVYSGFWDESYSSFLMNILGKMLNLIIGISSALGIYLAPFMFVVNRRK